MPSPVVIMGKAFSRNFQTNQTLNYTKLKFLNVVVLNGLSWVTHSTFAVRRRGLSPESDLRPALPFFTTAMFLN